MKLDTLREQFTYHAAEYQRHRDICRRLAAAIQTVEDSRQREDVTTMPPAAAGDTLGHDRTKGDQ